MDAETKVCKKCGEEYPLTAEYWHRDSCGFRARCKACVKIYNALHAEKRRQYNRKYYTAHREDRRQYMQKWYIANREKQKQYRMEWYMVNREKYLASCKAYREAQPAEKRRQYYRQYYTAHREELIKKAREYQQRRPEVVNVTAQRRYARKRGLPAQYTAADWQRALDYFHGCCAVCGRQLRDLFGTHTAAQDHWIPLSAPDCPGTVPTNIVPLCHGVGGCNNSKSDSQPDEWLRRRYGKRKAAAIAARVAEYFEWVESRQEDAA